MSAMEIYQVFPGVSLWLTNPDLHALSPRILREYPGVKRVIFLGFELDVPLFAEVCLLRDVVAVEIYDNTLPLDHDTPEYQTVMELADDLKAEGRVTLHLFETLRVPALIDRVATGSLREEGTLIVVNDGFHDDEDGGWYDSELTINALFALFRGLGLTYDGMRADAEILSHRELAKARGIDLELEVTDRGWLIDGVVSECLDMGDEGHFHHLLGSITIGLLDLLREEPLAQVALERFIDAVAFDPYETLQQVAEA